MAACHFSVIAMLGGVVAPADAAAQQADPAVTPAPWPEELLIESGSVIAITINGVPLQLEVSAEAFGPPVINPGVAERLRLVPQFRREWRFGPVSVTGQGAPVLADFGQGPVSVPLAWANRTASATADGVIGIHHLPYARVTVALAPPAAGESVQRFPLMRAGGTGNTRLGTEVTVGKKRLMMIFVPERAENLITAPTANFIATHQDGGFEPDTEGMAELDFAVKRPTRMMRIAAPIMLGDLAVERFAVRVEDYGDPKRVGEIGDNDPRFDKNQILVSARKGRGKPDLLTRIGRDQIAQCSRITYDLALSEIRLSCGPAPE